MLDHDVASELDSRAELGPHAVKLAANAPLRLCELLNDGAKSGGVPLKEEDDVFQFAPARAAGARRSRSSGDYPLLVERPGAEVASEVVVVGNPNRRRGGIDNDPLISVAPRGPEQAVLAESRDDVEPSRRSVAREGLDNHPIDRGKRCEPTERVGGVEDP